MRLKAKKIERDNVEVCAASRCHEPSTVILDLPGSARYGLCDRHYSEHCDDGEKDLSNSLDTRKVE